MSGKYEVRKYYFNLIFDYFDDILLLYKFMVTKQFDKEEYLEKFLSEDD